jgi:hypothetical protein
MCIMIALLLHGIGEEEKKVTVVRTWDYQGAAGVSVGETRRARPLGASEWLPLPQVYDKVQRIAMCLAQP